MAGDSASMFSRALRRSLLAVVLVVSVASAAGPPTEPVPARPVLIGTVTHVFDGDSMVVQLDSGPVTVRLDSIDTPEHDQPWGRQAAAALAGRIDGQRVALEVVTQDRYDRLVAVVFYGEENVNAWLVERGDAWAYRRYLSDDEYCVWEDEARAARRGLWSLPATDWRAPWEWRARERGQASTFTDYSRETEADCKASARRLRMPKPNAPAKSPSTASPSARQGYSTVSTSGVRATRAASRTDW
jgi:endonuclease YncB( thermonuclease family)